MTLLSLTLEIRIIYWFTISVLDCSIFDCGSNAPLAMRVVCTTSHESSVGGSVCWKCKKHSALRVPDKREASISMREDE